ncbi:unnamed protein product, partial [Closterium sp. NIES-53]
GGTAQEALELEALVLEVLELKELELLPLVVLYGRDRTSFPCFSRFLVPCLLLAFLPSCVPHLTCRGRRYSRPPHCKLLLLTLSSQAVLQSVVSLRLVLSHLFALLVMLEC